MEKRGSYPEDWPKPAKKFCSPVGILLAWPKTGCAVIADLHVPAFTGLHRRQLACEMPCLAAIRHGNLLLACFLVWCFVQSQRIFNGSIYIHFQTEVG
jgi:hypothetical protein